MKEKIYLALLHKIWLNHKKLHIIFEIDSNYKEFYNNLSSNILYTYGFTPKQIISILENKKKYKIADIETKLNERKVDLITFKDANFPNYLKEIFNPPFLLYVRWKLDETPKISVVWSRKISSYWEKVITSLVWDISNYFTIVSWWADWCDTFAHKTVLLKNKKTISIIWTWIDIDYPVFNQKLYNNIVSSWWAIISIFPIWEVWNPYNFPIRNEIVAWISSWVLIIEAQKKSWTLITANLALDLWKDLFAVPWDIFKNNSLGCNNLIKKWMAKLVIESTDILEEFNITNNWKNNNKKPIFDNKIEESIYNILLLDSLSIDELSNKLLIDVSTLSLKLSMMEINKIIKKTYWWKFEIF